MYVFKRFAVVGSSMLGEFSCTMVCIPYIASTVHGQVRLLLRIHIHVLISCSLRTTACGLLHISLRLSSVSPGICNTYHYVARCILRSHLLLRSLSPLFPLLSPLGVCIFFLAMWTLVCVQGLSFFSKGSPVTVFVRVVVAVIARQKIFSLSGSPWLHTLHYCSLFISRFQYHSDFIV